ncbi:MAG: riboflavin synthase [Mariprofundaceae bacterium]|nr:riboflavin synthase [Mariprofundaceae bacterium]
MFTGIIVDVGAIESINTEPQQSTLTFRTALDMATWQCGDSVAVDGCCLTITAFPQPQQWQAALSAETLALTHFSHAMVGQPMNMEPALRVGDPLGGHMVSGHIDAVGRLVRIEPMGEHRGYTFALPQELAPLVVHKGSIAVNGVSLTLNQVSDGEVTVNLIPHTLTHTNLGALHEGDRVNIETDILGRYVQRMLQYGVRDNGGMA